MAPVAGRPFLKIVIDYLLEQGVNKFIFSLGYMHEIIEDFLKNQYPQISYQIVIEDEPLGTGGAILLSSKKATEKNVLILNGDTLFKVNAKELLNYHLQQNAECTLTLKPMKDFDRYGVVDINKDGYIQSFKEKQHYQSGLINGGVYALNIDKFQAIDFPEKFSFEKEYLEAYYQSHKMTGLIQDSYFIDIGIPEDFEKASKEIN
jgi:D-glycero-alpha-D-manno-heptose 1-phosphate guanylyltransferase